MAFDPNNPTASGMFLTFDDEFNSVSWSDNQIASHTLWTDHGINPGSPNGIEALSGNAITVHNGMLDFTATNNNGQWTSGYLSTVNSSVQGFTQQYGYFEASIKIPHGAGAWPGFWMMDTNAFNGKGAPGAELDIMENAGANTTNFGGGIHGGAIGGNGGGVIQTGIDLSEGFHRFGLLWDPNSPNITWYLDGKAVMTAPKLSDTDPAQMMINLNLSLGNFGDGGPDASTPNPMHMYADYVRVYQFAGEPGTAISPMALSPAAGQTDPVALASATGGAAAPPANPNL